MTLRHNKSRDGNGAHAVCAPGEFFLELDSDELPWRDGAAVAPHGVASRGGRGYAAAPGGVARDSLPDPLGVPARVAVVSDGDDEASIGVRNASGVRLALPRKYFNGTLCDGVCFRFSLDAYKSSHGRLASDSTLFRLGIAEHWDGKPRCDTLASDGRLGWDRAVPVAYERDDYPRDTLLRCFCNDKRKEMLRESVGVLPWRVYERLGDQSVENGMCAEYSNTYATMYGLRQAVTLTTLAINKGLKVLFEQFAHFELRKSISEEALSIMSNVYFSTFINTGVLPLALNAKCSDLFESKRLAKNTICGLAIGRYDDLTRDWYANVGYQLCQTMLIILLFSVTLRFAIVLIVKPVLRIITTRDCVTQQQLNNAYLGNRWEVELRYADHLRMLFVGMLFVGALPIMVRIDAPRSHSFAW